MTFDLHCTTTAWFCKCCLFEPCSDVFSRSLHDTFHFYPHHSRHNRRFLFVVEWKTLPLSVIALENKQAIWWDESFLEIQSTLLEVIRTVNRKLNCENPAQRRRESSLTTRVQIKHTKFCSELPVLSCLFCWCVSCRHVPLYATLHPTKIGEIDFVAYEKEFSENIQL